MLKWMWVWGVQVQASVLRQGFGSCTDFGQRFLVTLAM